MSTPLLNNWRGLHQVEGVYQLSIRMRNRVTPPEIAPNVAPFLPATIAPTAVAMPAVAAIINASFSQDWRLPPPHNTTFASIVHLSQKISFRSIKHATFPNHAARSARELSVASHRQVRPQRGHR